MPKVVQAVSHWVASAEHVVEAHSANDSLSHRSFHHCIVTRLPNHMCASSCRIVSAAALDDRLGDLGPEDVHLVVGHRAGVLHRAHVVFGGEDLVVLGEGVGAVELVLVERESALGAVEDVVRVQVRGQRPAAQDAQRHGALAGLDLVADHVIRSGDQGGDVAGHARRGRKGQVATGTYAGTFSPAVVYHSHRVGVGSLDTTCQCAGAVTVKA